MRHLVLTKDKDKPRVVVELKCDIDLMIALIKDGGLDPAEVSVSLSKGVALIGDAMNRGLAKRAEQKAE